MIDIYYKKGTPVVYYHFNVVIIKKVFLSIEISNDKWDEMEKWLLQLITHRYDKNTNNIVPITEDYKKDFCRLKQHSVIKAGDFYYDFFDNCVRVGTGLLDK